jgi:hypothetical protein
METEHITIEHGCSIEVSDGDDYVVDAGYTWQFAQALLLVATL